MTPEEIGHLYKVFKNKDLNTVDTIIQNYIKKEASLIVILNEGLIRAMGIIKQDFEAGQVWMHGVLLAAGNMHRGINLLKPQLLKDPVSSRGKFLIGRVKSKWGHL